MKTPSRFLSKFSNLIVAVLSCFDRVIFKGYLPFNYQSGLEKFVDRVLQIRRTDFMAFAKEKSRLLAHPHRKIYSVKSFWP